jgi:hypothetical protein
MLGGLGALIFVELAKDRSDEIASGPFANVLSDRNELHFGLRELAPIALELELIAEETAEAVNDDQVVGPLTSGCRLDHCLKLRPIVIRRRRARLSEHVLKDDAASFTVGRDRCDLVGKAGLVLGLAIR